MEIKLDDSGNPIEEKRDPFSDRKQYTSEPEPIPPTKSSPSKTKPQRSNPLVLYIVGLALAAGGSCLYLFYIKPNMATAKQSKSWPSVKGKVLDVDIDRTGSGDDVSYKIHATYTYNVNGKDYRSDRLVIGPTTSHNSRFTARSVAKEKGLVTGNSVTVYFDPDNPRYATLTTGVGIGLYVFLAASAIMAIIGVIILFFRIKALFTSRPSYN